MAMWSAKREFILKAVEEMYTDVASRPGAVFHFPTGRLACLFVGYPADQLDCLPAEATESFAGVGYPFAADVIRRRRRGARHRERLRDRHADRGDVEWPDRCRLRARHDPGDAREA